MVSSGFDGFSKTEWKKPWRGLLVTYLLLSSILDLKTWWNEDLVLKCRNIHFSKRNIQNDSKLSSVISYVFRANTKIEEIICWRLNPMNYNMIIHVMSCHVMSCLFLFLLETFFYSLYICDFPNGANNRKHLLIKKWINSLMKSNENSPAT